MKHTKQAMITTCKLSKLHEVHWTVTSDCPFLKQIQVNEDLQTSYQRRLDGQDQRSFETSKMVDYLTPANVDPLLPRRLQTRNQLFQLCLGFGKVFCVFERVGIDSRTKPN